MATGDREWRGVWATVALACMLSIVVALLTLLPFVREAQVRLTDTLFWIAPSPSTRAPIVIVTIDEQSLERYGRWPWSRTRVAELLDNISSASPNVVGLDILLSEPQSIASDEAFRSALLHNKKTVLVDKIGILPSGPQWIEPLPQFADSAIAIGHTHAVLDVDGICRRFQPVELSPSGERYAFAIEVAKHVEPASAARFMELYQPAVQQKSSNVLKLQPAMVRIPFRSDAFEMVRASDVLEKRGLERTKNHAVLVGFGPTDIGDRVVTPLSTELPVPGVQVHAQILDAILTGRYLRESPWWFSAILLLAACAGIVLTSRRWRGLASLITLPTMMAMVYIVGLTIFVFFSVILPIGPIMLGVVLGPILVSTVDLALVERSVGRQLDSLQSLLGKTNSPDDPDSKTLDLTLRINALGELQTRLGSRYELYEALLEATQDAIAIFDDSGDLLLTNKAFAMILGVRPGNRLTLSALRSQLVDNPEVPASSKESQKEQEVFVGHDLYLMRTGPLPYTSLSPRGGTIVTLSSLRNRVERDRARSEALGFITHELRTPLAAIQGFAELIMHDPVASTAEGAPETIYRESQRLLALIGSYLDVLRLDAGAKPIASHVIDLEGWWNRSSPY
ncbi:MAG TPA: CHASE2 domain-containing protein [Terriglobales bacterium]|nr:CHASE2 domain-containing protein [Terriglobales bacterium]